MKRLLIYVCALSMIDSMSAVEKQWTSSTEQVPLVELYSSQGCSSCPLAELWLSKLTQSKDLWQRLVPVAFHVDYWDYLGWKDPFSAAKFSQRERDYAAAWHASSVYTPCIVVAGKEYKAWRSGLLVPPSKKVGVLSLKITNQENFMIQFAPEHGEKNYTVHVAWLGFGLSTAVKSGENAGKTLRGDFVVLRHEQSMMSLGTKGYEVTIKLSMPLEKTSLAAVAWVENSSGEPVQAVGGYFME